MIRLRGHKEASLDSASTIRRELTGRKLSPTTGYIDATDPRQYGSDPAGRVEQIIESLGPVKKVIVDLRFAVPEYGNLDWLRLFLDSPQSRGGVVMREHNGWNELNVPYIYSQRWTVTSPSVLSPPDGKRPVSIPAAFVVNCFSYRLAADVLDVLQTSKGDVVILEHHCRFPAAYVQRFPENVEVALNTSLLLSKSGNLGAQADYATARALGDKELADLADTLTAERQRGLPKPRHPFTLQMIIPPREQPSLDSLTRERRLLGLFKVWIVMSYLDPHLGNAAIDWDAALGEWISRVEAAHSMADYYDVIQRLTATLNDSHISYLHPLLWTRRMLPLQIQHVEGKPIVVGRLPGPGEPPPVRIGDEILAIDGTNVTEMFARYAPLISASTRGARERDMVKWLNLAAEKQDAVDVVLQNDDGSRTVRLKSIPRTAAPPTPVKLLEQQFGYISVGSMNAGQFESALSQFAGAKGLILDVRTYPAFDAASIIIPRIIDTRVRTNFFAIPIASTPDRRTKTMREVQGWYEPAAAHRYTGALVALFDERTQSNAEHLLINLKGTGRVTFVGSTSAGANGDVTALYLPGGGSFAFTGGVIRFADGSKFQNVGVTPDVEIRPTIRGIRQGRDEVLEKGIEVLRSLLH